MRHRVAGTNLCTCPTEEVVQRRRRATTTTRNVERRTQRDLLLQDGRVVGDTGPTVTEDVTEETQVRETTAHEVSVREKD